MNNEQLQELLLLQTNITTTILVITALILAGVALDVLLHLYNKYVKKVKNDK